MAKMVALLLQQMFDALLPLNEMPHYALSSYIVVDRVLPAA